MESSSLPTIYLLDALREGIQVIGADWRYRYVNPAAARHGHTTPDALVGRTMMEAYPGIDALPVFAELERCMRTRQPTTLENEFHYQDGSSGYFELRVDPVPGGICILSIDVTTRKRAETRARESEERLRHGERLESIGRLSAGVAHDFNNLLGVILGQGEVALARAGGPTVADVQIMIDVARRSSALTRELLAFGRSQVLRSRVVDPRDVVAGLETILRRALGGQVELVLDITRPVGSIEIDPSKLEQVLMNLVINARDAMPSGGRVAISLADATLGPGEAQRPGPHVVLSVSDDGIGMDADTRARIFEPFFTTKKDSGTGLGLATVYGIVYQSGGSILVSSELGLGTTFKLHFPRIDAKPPVAEPERAAAEPDERAGLEGDETLLIAEDHPSLRALAEDVLSDAGYRVLAAESGTEALELVRTEPAIALLITDVVLPGIRGPELVERARSLRPDLRFIYTSGYADDGLRCARGLPNDAVFLEKPYLPSTLLRTVRELLDRRSP